MWDENKVLDLLKGMPHVLTEVNLCEIQKLIDDNKYWNSRELNMDLCGVYAPFCKICDKTVLTPCAVAYVRMKIAEGMDLKMENISSEIKHPVSFNANNKSETASVEKEVEAIEEQPAISKKIRIGVGYRNF